MVLSDSHSMLKSNLLRTYGLLMRPSGQAMRHLRFMPSAVIGVAQQPTKFAVIGAGLAGLATTWHLLKQYPAHSGPVVVHLIDAEGLCAGGSGAAAGLLHPTTPKGKLLWKGKEAMQAALELLDAAEQERLRQGTKPFVWKTGMVRPAHTLRQAVQFHKATSSAAASDSGDPLAEPITSQRLQQLIQGVQCFSMATEQTSTADVAQEKQIPSKQQPDVGDASSCVAASNWTHIAAQAAIGAVKDAVKGAVACAVVGVVLGAAWGALLVFLLCAVFQSVFYPILALLAFGFGSGVKSMDDAFKGAYEDLCYEGAREGAVSGAKIGVLLGAIVGAIAGAVRAAIKATSAQSKGKAVSAALACTLPVAGKVAGIVIPEGVTIDVPRYAEALWASCKRMAADRMDGSTAEVHIETVHSVTALHASASGPYDAVVVAAGAAVDTIQELQGVLPIQICQGYTLTMRPGSCKPYPHDAPSILGQTYIAAHGPHSLVVGATKSYGWSPQQALAMCHPRMSKVASGMHDKNRDIASPTTNINNNNTSGSRIGTSSDEARGISRQFRCQNDLAGAPGDTPAATHSTEAVAAAKEELMAGAALAWPPITGWDVYEVRSGMRALPPRTPHGSVPMVGRIKAPDHTQQLPHTWVVGGLGARGLVYHGWLGAWVARAVIAGDEGVLPPELLAWRGVRAGAGSQEE